MVDKILKFTKLTFIIHFIVGLLFTILFWIPDITIPMYGISASLETHAMSLTIGALFAGFTVSSLCGIRAKEWKEVKIVVEAEMIWLLAGVVTHIISFSVYELGMAILTLIVNIIFLVLFLLTFLQQQEKIKTLWE